MLLAELELDLDVFSGPFDLLLTLVLREEVDLRELALAEVVVAYLDHLDARGELDLEATTEFIVLVAALLELKSRLLLPGEEDELLELEPGEAAEELLARMLEARRYRAAAAHLGSASPRSPRSASARRRCRPTCAGARSRRRGADLGPQGARPRARRPARPARPARPRHISVMRVSVASGSPTCAACCARPRAELRRRRARRRPDDGRGHAVGAARAPQAGGGELGAGRAVRRDHGHRRRLMERARAHRRGAAVPLERAGLDRRARRRVPASRGAVEAALAELARRLRPGRARADAARARRRLDARERPGRRGRGAAAARQAAPRDADAGPARDARDRRLPPARLAAGDRPHPRRQRRLAGRHAARPRPDRGERALAVRRRPLPDDHAVPQALRPAGARRAARRRAVGSDARGAGDAARPPARRRRGARRRRARAPRVEHRPGPG